MPVARDSLIQDVWGLRFDPGSNVVDAVVASLRRKLGGLSGAIETVRGFGYRLPRVARMRVGLKTSECRHGYSVIDALSFLIRFPCSGSCSAQLGHE